MKAQKIMKERLLMGDGRFAEISVWEVPEPVFPAVHRYKYRLAYVVDGVCVIRFDNERGKGDHFHWGSDEKYYGFTTVDALFDDFLQMIDQWERDNGHDDPDDRHRQL